MIGDTREYKDYVRDCAAFSTYSSYFLIGVLVFLGLTMGFKENVLSAVPEISKVYFLLGLLASALCSVSWPIHKRVTDLTFSRVLWTWKILMLDAAIFLTAGGVIITVIQYG